MSRLGDSVTTDSGGVYSNASDIPSSKPSSNPSSEAISDRVMEVLGGLPEGERAALVDHVERLANLTPAMRDAVLSLAVQLSGGGE